MYCVLHICVVFCIYVLCFYVCVVFCMFVLCCVLYVCVVFYKPYLTLLSGQVYHNVSKQNQGLQPLTDHCWLQVNNHSSWNMFSSAIFTEESVERIITTADGLVIGHLTVGLDSMLQTVQFPTSISNLDSGLANMDRDTLALQEEK